MHQDRIRRIVAHLPGIAPIEAQRSPLHRFEDLRGFDTILAAIVLAAGARAGVVTCHQRRRPAAPSVLSVAGTPLRDEVLGEVLAAAGTEPLPPPGEVDGWQVVRIKIRARADQDMIVLSLLSDSPGWACRLGRPGGLDGLRPLIDATFDAWRQMNVAQSGLQGLTTALDGVDIGILLLDRQSSVSFANRAAQEILDEGSYLRWAGDKIAGIDMRESLALQVAVQHAIADNGVGIGSRDAPVLALRSARTGSRIIVSIVPRVARAAVPDDVAAVVYLLDPAVDTTKQLQPVCRLYRLSAVEGRLACLLTAGESLREAAETMRIKEPTARGYLKQIFFKTDTNRQADLVRLMLTSVLRMQRDIDPVFLA